MKLQDLRKLIKEEVESVLDEADKAKKGPPKSFGEFRKQLAAALKKAKAPAALVSEVGDTDDEGGGVASVCFSAWRNIEMELKDEGANAAAAWPDLVGYYVHDCVIDMLDEFKNPMNYAPGAKKGEKPVDAAALAQAVVAAMAPVKKKSPEEMKKRELLDMANLVIDVLEATDGAVTNVQWDGKSPRVTYKIMMSDYLEQIGFNAPKAGFKPMGPEDEAAATWVDDITGLKVTFGDGVAVIE